MYGIVKYSGIQAYTSGLICKQSAAFSGAVYTYMINLFGTATALESISSAIFSSHGTTISWEENGQIQKFDLHRSEYPMVSDFRKKYEGGVATKTLYSPIAFGILNASVKMPESVIITGEDMPTVKKRAFLRLDQRTAVPLKEQWIDFLWDEMLQPEKLISWGSPELTEAWEITIPSDDELQEFVLEGIRNEYLN